MEYAEPKTRKEKKGGKQKDTPYSQKRIRQIQAIIEKKGIQPQAPKKN